MENTQEREVKLNLQEIEFLVSQLDDYFGPGHEEPGFSDLYTKLENLL